MSGFEIAGIALAGPAVVGQLLKVTLEGYHIFTEAAAAGNGLQSCERSLRVQRERLEDWIKQLSFMGGDLSVLIEAKRYELILDTLAAIAGVFARADELETKYGIRRICIQGETEAPATREDNPVDRVAEKPRSKIRTKLGSWLGKRTSTPSQNTVRGNSSQSAIAAVIRAGVSTAGLVTPEAVKSDARSQQSTASALERIDINSPVNVRKWELQAADYQSSLSSYRRYRWALSTKTELNELLKDLRHYVNELHQLLPPTLSQNTFAILTIV